jgi:UDP:flavonoid glycosyltransferase YjiC (YdhE family)
MGRDQADNAARVVYHGAGKRMRANATVDEIRDAVTNMLDDGRYRAAAERLARTMQADTVDDRAVRELELLTPGLQN